LSARFYKISNQKAAAEPMFTLLVTLIIIISILLSVVVLSQSSKGDGLAGGLGAPGGMGAMMGLRRATDFLMKATIGLAAAFAVLTILTNIFFLPSGPDNGASPVQSGPSPVPSMPQGPSQPQQSAPAVQQSAPAAQPAPQSAPARSK
jgi:preprotein translocase subunit SecG